MHPSFRIYEEATPELIAFLSNTILGSKGAQYQHLNTAQRIQELENPLHLSFIRNGKILGNISFARRGKNWYVRYFAFEKVFQGNGQSSKNRKKKSFLKDELKAFFAEKIKSGEVDCFYAYIDPHNDKSHALAKELGFTKTGELSTQTFSRLFPKKSKRFFEITDTHQRDQFIQQHFSDKPLFHVQNVYENSFCLKNTDGDIIAFAQTNEIKWKIHRLPGKQGHLLVKLLPYIPFISRIIKPKNHSFIGIDHVWVENNNHILLQELFSSILKAKNHKMILWWNNQTKQEFKNTKHWGVMHALLQKNDVDTYITCSHLFINSLSNFIISKDFT